MSAAISVTMCMPCATNVFKISTVLFQGAKERAVRKVGAFLWCARRTAQAVREQSGVS